MKLASFAIGGLEGFGAVTDSGVIGLTGRLAGRHQTLREVLEAEALDEARAVIKGVEADYPVDKVEFLLPISNPEKIYCVGQNYREHILEMGYEIPTSPSIFSRYARTFVPHNGTMDMPSHSEHFDYEAEMTIVIPFLRYSYERCDPDAPTGPCIRKHHDLRGGIALLLARTRPACLLLVLMARCVDSHRCSSRGEGLKSWRGNVST